MDCSKFSIFLLTPMAASLFQSRSCLIESKAFAKSTKHAYIGLCLFLYDCIVVDRMKIGCEVLLPFLNPNWASFSLLFSSAQYKSLSLIIDVNNLPSTGSRVTPYSCLDSLHHFSYK